MLLLSLLPLVALVELKGLAVAKPVSPSSAVVMKLCEREGKGGESASATADSCARGRREREEEEEEDILRRWFTEEVLLPPPPSSPSPPLS